MRRVLGPVERQRSTLAVAVVTWGALVAMVVLWGRWLRADQDIGVDAPPFYGRWERYVAADLAVPVVVAALLIWFGPLLVDRLTSWLVPLVAGAASVVWALALQQADDKSVTKPLVSKYDYLSNLPAVESPSEYLRTFIERLPTYPTHVRGHPPGTVLVAWALDQVGLSGPTWFLALILLVWGLGIAAVLVALGAVAGDEAARRAALPVALAPGAVWVATSADPLFGGVIAISLALIVVALAGPPALRFDLLALVGGALFGGALLLTYGAVPLIAVPMAVALHRQRIRPVIAAVAGTWAVLAVVGSAGFWWFDGLAAVRVEYDKGISNIRPYSYFVIANLAVFAVACGPAIAAGIGGVQLRLNNAWLRFDDVWLLPLGGFGAMLIADLSGLSKAEVERIWLPFVPWALTIVATTRERVVPMRLLLAGQVACGIVVQVVLRSEW